MAYLLDLQTMLEQLAGRSGILEADVKLNTYGRMFFYARLKLIAGKVNECILTPKNGNGPIISDREAITLLQQIGEVRWTYTSEVIQTSPVSPPSTALAAPSSFRASASYGIRSSAIPHQLRVVSAQELRAWPRAHRLVFSLVDGQKSLQDIARLLNQSSAALLPIFQDLQSRSIITLSETRGTQ